MSTSKINICEWKAHLFPKGKLTMNNQDDIEQHKHRKQNKIHFAAMKKPRQRKETV